MLKYRLVILGVIALVVAALAVTLPDVAHADTPRGERLPCATRAEFHALDLYGTRAAVVELLDGPGVRSDADSTHATVARYWRVCGQPADVGRLTVWFPRDGRGLNGAAWLVLGHGYSYSRVG